MTPEQIPSQTTLVGGEYSFITTFLLPCIEPLFLTNFLLWTRFGNLCEQVIVDG